MTRVRSVGCAVAAGVCLAGCQNRPAVAEASVRDSAGVRIVEHGDVAGVAAPLRLSGEPVYRVGWGPGEHEFASVDAATLLVGGRAAVVDAQARQVVIVSAAGRVESILGGPGQGPGELSFPWSVLRLAGDTLAVQDVGLNKFVLFHDGAFVRDVSLAALGFASRNRAVGLEPGGRLLLGIPSSFSPTFEEPWVRMPLLTLDLRAPRLDTIGHYDFAQNMEAGGANPFRGGYGRVWAAGGRFVVGRADRMELTWTAPDGTLEQIVRWRFPPEPLTESFWAEYETAMRARLSGSRTDEQMRTLLADQRAGAGSTLPIFAGHFGGSVGDAAGNLWLGAFGADFRFVPRYTVIAGSGEWLGSVTTPPRSVVLAVDGDLALLLELDELEVPAVALYRIEGG